MQNRNPRRSAQHWFFSLLFAATILSLAAAQSQAQRTQEQKQAAFDASTSDASRGAFIDCNANGVSDDLDISAGTSRDCNATGIPDECEPFTKLTSSDNAERDFFGRSVSVSGNTAIVGADGDEHTGGTSPRNEGSAYIFQFDGTSWVEEQKLTASDAAPNDEFGVAVSVSGDTAIVGAQADDDAGDQTGSAYVFRFDGANWVEEQKLTASDAEGGVLFGGSVSVSGNTAIVGASYHDGAGPNSGAAYVFRFDGTSWVEEQKLTASDTEELDRFGVSVAVDGNTAVLGAHRNSDAGTWSGSAYIFRFDGTSWIEEQKLTASDAAADDFFGSSVSVSGGTAVVGASQDDGSGSAYVFRFDGTSWIEEQKLTASDAAADDFFGRSVSVSGDTVVVGANQDDGSGSAYVFRFDGTIWVQEQKLSATDAADNDQFGYSVSVSGDTTFVGAYSDDNPDEGSGSAYVFFTSPVTCTDVDCDGYGSPGDASCASGIAEDCDDSDSTVYPGNSETICNSIDDDCDAATPDQPSNAEISCNGIDDDCDPDTTDVPGGTTDDCNGNGLADECDIIGGASPDNNGNGVPDECETAPPAVAPAPHDFGKNRYISFAPNNGATPVAFEVTLSDGRSCWVGEPCIRSDTNGVDPQWVAECVESAAGDGSDMVRDWTSYTDPATGDPVVHVRGCVILPDETYNLRTVMLGLSTAPLAIGTVPTPTISGSWADIVGDFEPGTAKWGPPDSNTAFKDIAASVQAFQKLGTLPVTWADLTPYGNSQPNYVVSFSDIGAVIQGFHGIPYPGTVADCAIPATAEACP